MTKFSGTLPKGDANGLNALANQLLKNPKGTHIIVGVIDVKTITTDVDTADQQATVRFRRVESIAPQDADHAVRMMQRAAERRTGATMLPIEIEDELQELMQNLDFDFSTGEVFGGDAEAIKGEPGHEGEEEAGGEPAAPAAEPGEDTEPPNDPGPEPGEDPETGQPGGKPGKKPKREKPAEGPATGPDAEPPGLDDNPHPAEPAPDDAETDAADAEPLPAAEPGPAEPAEPAAPAPKKRGRPRKNPTPAPAPEIPEDLAAASVPAAPWDTATEEDGE